MPTNASIIPEGVTTLYVVSSEDFHDDPDYMLVSFTDKSLEGAVPYLTVLEEYGLDYGDYDEWGDDCQALANKSGKTVVLVELDYDSKAEVLRESYKPGVIWTGDWEDEEPEEETLEGDSGDPNGSALGYGTPSSISNSYQPDEYKSMGIGIRAFINLLVLISLVTFIGLFAWDSLFGLPEAWTWWPF